MRSGITALDMNMLLDDTGVKEKEKKKLPPIKNDGEKDFVLFEEKDLEENRRDSEKNPADSKEYGNQFIENFKKEAGIEERLTGQKVSNGALKIMGIENDTFERLGEIREEGKENRRKQQENFWKNVGSFFAKPDSQTTKNQAEKFGNGRKKRGTG